jgi:hypothetical protein
MSEEKPRKIPRVLSCLVKGPLGCLAFLVGASVVLVLFLPFAAGRLTDRLVEEWFAEHYHGALELSDAWVGSLYGPQEVGGLILRDPNGDEVLRASLRAPAIRLAFSQHAYGPVEIHVNVLRLVQAPDGTSGLVRALRERDELAERRESRRGLETDVPMHVSLQVALDRLRWTGARGEEGALDNLRFEGQIEWTPERVRVVLHGGSDPLVPEPLTVHVELVRPESGPSQPWTVAWSCDHVPSVLAAILCGSAASPQSLAGPYVDGVRWTSTGELVELALEDEGASLALQGQRSGSSLYSNLPGQAVDVVLPVNEPWLAKVLLPLLPGVGALEPEPDGSAALRLDPYRIDLAGPVPVVTGELAFDVGFRSYALAPAIVAQLREPFAVPQPGVVRQHVTLREHAATFSDLSLPCEGGTLELEGALDLASGAYDVGVSAMGPGGELEALRLSGPRDGLAPAPPALPGVPVPPVPGG